MPPRSTSPSPSNFHPRVSASKPEQKSTADEDSHGRYDRRSGMLNRMCMLVPPTISLPLLVMFDMFSVSLVVPLLFQYYKSAGVNSASQREMLTSLFSASQIIGGLTLGALADTGFFPRRTVLFISFAGSALSYALILHGGFSALVCSRVLVGLVKQTMTVTTTMIVRCTTKEDRAKHIGR